jgi:hypothetical protein
VQNANVEVGLDKHPVSLSSKMLMGLTSGGIGSFVSIYPIGIGAGAYE